MKVVEEGGGEGELHVYEGGFVRVVPVVELARAGMREMPSGLQGVVISCPRELKDERRSDPESFLRLSGSREAAKALGSPEKPIGVSPDVGRWVVGGASRKTRQRTRLSPVEALQTRLDPEGATGPLEILKAGEPAKAPSRG